MCDTGFKCFYAWMLAKTRGRLITYLGFGNFDVECWTCGSYNFMDYSEY